MSNLSLLRIIRVQYWRKCFVHMARTSNSTSLQAHRTFPIGCDVFRINVRFSSFSSIIIQVPILSISEQSVIIQTILHYGYTCENPYSWLIFIPFARVSPERLCPPVLHLPLFLVHPFRKIIYVKFARFVKKTFE